jgi:hypothetical protein
MGKLAWKTEGGAAWRMITGHHVDVAIVRGILHAETPMTLATSLLCNVMIGHHTRVLGPHGVTFREDGIWASRIGQNLATWTNL